MKLSERIPAAPYTIENYGRNEFEVVLRNGDGQRIGILDFGYTEKLPEAKALMECVKTIPEMLAILERLEHWQDKNTDDTLDKICHDAHLLYQRLNS